ncbi:MAG: acyl-CoA dehydrogenase [Kribbellaceae bacterium]|jgi:alkylation response protein AidB-like acyl-CoA dehydrogenase|nr:acyl-CoA dehydrogenase [Kribbellaceae bacterium]
MIGHRPVYDQDHKDFRASVRRFLEREIAPYFEAWEEAEIVDRDLWTKAGQAGMLCPQLPEEYGGTGDFRFNAVLIEECSYAGFAGPAGNFTAHSDVACGYVLDFGNELIRKTWLPRMLSGEAVCSIAMSEPAAGSDLQGLLTRAVRDGDEYVLNGQKTFISNGQHCDIAVVVARTSGRSGGMSLFLVEADRPGFTRGRNLEKLGHHSSDTSELSFVDVRIPAGNLLGEEGRAMEYMMRELPQERLIIAVASIAAAQKAFDITVDYVNTRTAFGKTVGSMQNTRFTLADLKADLSVGWAYVDQCLAELTAGVLTTERASIAKLWVTEMQGRLVDRCLQFFGGYGFMREYEICRLYADARVQRIYGGTSEIMREIIARSL